MKGFYGTIDRPLAGRARMVLALLAIPIALSFTAPLWKIHLEAPQYPMGLDLEIYAYELRGGHHGRDLQEINTLNHYIGMRHIDESAMPELDWAPFALGALILLCLRTAAVGNIRSLIDLVVLSSYALGFLGLRYVYMLYHFGHDLASDAPMTVAPFMPAVLGTKQIANFTTSSWPQLGAIYAGAFLIGIAAVLLWQLRSGRRADASGLDRDRSPTKATEGYAATSHAPAS